MTDLGFIVKMVIYKCRELGNPVTETLAAYVAQTTLNKSKTQLHKYMMSLTICKQDPESSSLKDR